MFPNGEKAEETYTAYLDAGERYSVTSPAVDGYTPDQAVVTGLMPAWDK